MINLLEAKMEKKKVKDMIDGFNTEHLKALFNECSSETASNNLKVTQELFKKALRR